MIVGPSTVGPYDRSGSSFNTLQTWKNRHFQLQFLFLALPQLRVPSPCDGVYAASC